MRKSETLNKEAAFLAGDDPRQLKTMEVEHVVRRTDLFVGIGAICRQFGGSVTSWWRSHDHNAGVGGKPNSLHILGLACDVVYDSPPELGKVISVANVYGLRVLRETDHDHIEAVLTK